MRRSFIAVLVVASLLSLFYCKPDPDTSNAIDFKRTTNDVIIASISDAEVLNPILSTTGYANVIHEQIFQFLEYIDHETGALIPHLAKAKPTIEDIVENGEVTGTKFTFELREDAVWPNASPVLAEDFVFALKATFNPKIPAEQFRGYLASIKSIEIDPTNPKRFSVSTREKYFLNEATITAAIPVMPRYHYDPEGLLNDIDLNDLLDPAKATKLGDSNPNLQAFADSFMKPEMGQKPVGSGAYELVEWEAGQRVVLKKKADWWGEKYKDTSPLYQANVDAINYRVIPDNNVALTEIKAEQIDVNASMDPTSFSELKNNALAKERYNFYQMPNLVYYFLYLNHKDVRLNDKRVRRAVAHVVNIDEIIETVYEGGAQRVNGPVHPTKPYYRADLPPIPFDIEKAKSLLATAGWEDTNDNGIVDKEIEGERIELELDFTIAAGRQTNEDLAAIFSKEAIKAGIKINPVAKEGKVMRGDMNARNFQIAVAGARNAPVAWDPRQRFHSESDVTGGFNLMGFSNEAVDALIDEIRLTLDEEKRNKLYKELQGILYEEQPLVFMFTSSNNIVIHKRFQTKPSGVRPGYFPNTFVLNEQ